MPMVRFVRSVDGKGVENTVDCFDQILEYANADIIVKWVGKNPDGSMKSGDFPTQLSVEGPLEVNLATSQFRVVVGVSTYAYFESSDVVYLALRPSDDRFTVVL